MEDQIDDHDMGVKEREFMEEAEQVVEKYTIPGKTKHDAEKLAVHLLAMRLVQNSFSELK